MAGGFPAGLGGGYVGKPYQAHIPVKADRADSADIQPGDVLQYLTTIYDGMSVKQPATARLLTDFAGVAVQHIAHGQYSNVAVCYEGVVSAKVLGATTQVQGAWLTPVNAKDYFANTTADTGIMLLTDLSSTTTIPGPGHATLEPWIWIQPGTGGRRTT